MLLEMELVYFQGHLQNVRVGLCYFNTKVTARLLTEASCISSHSPNQQTVIEVHFFVKANL